MIKWSEHKKGNDDCGYDHVITETPLGKVYITWKSWKDHPSYNIEFRGIDVWGVHFFDDFDFYGYELDGVKKLVEEIFIKLKKDIVKFLE